MAATSPIDFDGLRIFDYTGEANLSSSLAFIEVPAGAQHAKARSRRSDKYYLVTEGQVEFTIGDSVARLNRGDFCHVPQGEVFGYINTRAAPAALVLVHTPAFDLSAEEFVT